MSKNLPTKLIDEAGDNVDVRYAASLQTLTDWVDTTNFIAVAGRGTAKSTVIIARRIISCINSMPGAPLAIVADTYTNLVNNIMPAVQNGWRIHGGLVDGIHYVKGKRPPKEWSDRCSVIVNDYKYTYSFWNGCVLFLGSLDSPSLLAGKSVAHLFFDEAKFASDARAARVMPVLRGDAITYGASHLYGGVTITTDMPDVTEGEFDWFFRYAAEMDPEMIVRIIQAASVRNSYLVKLARANAAERPDLAKIARLEQKIAYYDEGLRKLRRGQTFFVNLSSFANIDILTLDYARRLYNGALEHHEFMKSVVGMRPGVRRSSRFYILFGEEHKYSDATRSGAPAFNSSELRFLDPDRPLEGGMDFGNMLSLIIAQPDGPATYRIHKNFYELPPAWMRELADQFLNFFASHRCRKLFLFYDRAGNNYRKQGKDSAGEFKKAVEFDADGQRTGWTVVLMSRGQAVIRQNAEYYFMLSFMRGDNRRLPRLLVDAVNCAELVSSIELAKQEVKYRHGVKLVVKVKRSEKLDLKKLPKLSTNFSDAFKYLAMRSEWLAAARPEPTGNSGGDALADEWAAKNLGK